MKKLLQVIQIHIFVCPKETGVRHILPMVSAFGTVMFPDWLVVAVTGALNGEGEISEERRICPVASTVLCEFDDPLCRTCRQRRSDDRKRQ